MSDPAHRDAQPAISKDAAWLWISLFRGPKNTLNFGGDHAEMEITQEARAALNELLEIGAVTHAEPDDQWPGREYYKSTGMDLRKPAQATGINPFSQEDALVIFRRKGSDI
jgi:hypothetical protein